MAIYDCFTFFNEIELLEMRLKLLDEVVDYFVIIELNKTHRGFDKEFNFERNKKMFEEYEKKILYLKIEDIPIPPPAKQNSIFRLHSLKRDWRIENFQRNCIARALKECDPDDFIIISDMDEIPNPSLLKDFNLMNLFLFGHIGTGIKNKIKVVLRSLFMFPKLVLRNNRFSNLIEKTPIVFEQDLFYYYLNCKSRGKWYGSIITKYKNLRTIQDLRNSHNFLPRIQNGGWHFSYLGGIDRIKMKLNSTVDGEPGLAIDAYIEDCLERGVDPYGRKGRNFEYDFISKEEIGIKSIEKFIKKYPWMYKFR